MNGHMMVFKQEMSRPKKSAPRRVGSLGERLADVAVNAPSVRAVAMVLAACGAAVSVMGASAVGAAALLG